MPLASSQPTKIRNSPHVGKDVRGIASPGWDNRGSCLRTTKVRTANRIPYVIRGIDQRLTLSGRQRSVIDKARDLTVKVA